MKRIFNSSFRLRDRMSKIWMTANPEFSWKTSGSSRGHRRNESRKNGTIQKDNLIVIRFTVFFGVPISKRNLLSSDDDSFFRSLFFVPFHSRFSYQPEQTFVYYPRINTRETMFIYYTQSGVGFGDCFDIIEKYHIFEDSFNISQIECVSKIRNPSSRTVKYCDATRRG